MIHLCSIRALWRDLTRRRHPLATAPDPAPAPDEAGDYVPERGFWLGPTLPVGERPWPSRWERTADECPHQRWERVVVRHHGRTADEPVVRCVFCHVPRCGHSDEADPCMERRHHRTVHVYLSGRFEPVGGML